MEIIAECAKSHIVWKFLKIWYNKDTKRAEQQLDSDVDRWKDGGRILVYNTANSPKLERCYFFILISIILTMSDTNATSKDAKEHTNVKVS